jgi:hypothetical protein
MKKAHLCAFPGRAGSADDVINHERCECMLVVQSRRTDGSLIACRAECGMPVSGQVLYQCFVFM